MKKTKPDKNQAAVELSKLGASKGGLARAAALSPRKRSMIARAAARTRWGMRVGQQPLGEALKGLQEARKNVVFSDGEFLDGSCIDMNWRKAAWGRWHKAVKAYNEVNS